jgi:nicotinamide mononucleotide transporter
MNYVALYLHPLNMQYLELMLAEAATLSWIDWVATITALLYVVLAARQNSWCWMWGMISCSLWAYASFTFYQLYLDALLQIFYVVMAVVGWYQWKRGGTAGRERPITRLPFRAHLIYLSSGILAAILFGYLFEAYTPAAATHLDALTTIFSILATFMLVQKRLDNWAYWVVIDLLYMGLYASRGAYLFALLMLVYTLIAARAWWNWRIALKQVSSRSNPF